MKAFIICDLLFLFFVIMAGFMLITIYVKGKRNHNYPQKSTIKNPKYAILIPAKDESKVIEQLLLSIKKQTYKLNMNDVYVIVEQKSDPTVKICDKYNASIIIRKHLELKRKGYALDEGIKFILNTNKRYDAYFIFDADNILDENYLKNMDLTYKSGYDIGIGYRNTKNGNENVIAASSTLTFSMINTIGNERKNAETRNITISGTGFYIKGSFVDKWGGYPFHTLTEDYELTLYASLNSLTSFYNKEAVFYDEQPTNYKVTVLQRIRWIKGFFEARKIYAKRLRKKGFKNSKNSGSQYVDSIIIIPFLIIIVPLIILNLIKLGISIYNLIIKSSAWPLMFILLFTIFIACYIGLLIFTLIILIKEKDRINLNTKMKIKALFFNPIFLISYVQCAIKALTQKEVTWVKIDHQEKKIIK